MRRTPERFRCRSCNKLFPRRGAVVEPSRGTQSTTYDGTRFYPSPPSRWCRPCAVERLAALDADERSHDFARELRLAIQRFDLAHDACSHAVNSDCPHYS